MKEEFQLDLFSFLGLEDPGSHSDTATTATIEPPIVLPQPSYSKNAATPKKRTSTSNGDKASRLREMADAMQKDIDYKMNPAATRQRVTQRRAAEIDRIRGDGRRLQLIQGWLYAIADAIDNQILPDILGKVETKKVLEIFTTLQEGKWTDKDLAMIWSGSASYRDWASSLGRAGINNVEECRQALNALTMLNPIPHEDPLQVKIHQLEMQLIGCKIAGYFPTPKDIAKEVVEKCGIQPGDVVWEPSAGKGDIAQAIRDKHPDAKLLVTELSPSLREILKLKQFHLVGSDCFDFDRMVDRIVMNPPFEKGQDTDHVRFAYDRLNPGGRLVAITSVSWTFNQQKKFKEFREWLAQLDSYHYNLPEGAFYASDRPTGVRCCVIVIEK